MPRYQSQRGCQDRVPVSGVTRRGRRDLRQGRVDQAATAGSLMIGLLLQARSFPGSCSDRAVRHGAIKGPLARGLLPELHHQPGRDRGLLVLGFQRSRADPFHIGVLSPGGIPRVDGGTAIGL